MKQHYPLISVIIPAYNGEAYLVEAINSIVGQWPSLEIILIDDGSTDGTAALIRTHFPEVIYHHQINQGIGAARDQGIALASGEFIAFLDADDYWLDGKLKQQMEIFKEQPETQMVFGHIRQFISPELTKQEGARLHCPDELMAAELPSTMLSRRDAVNRVGPFASRWQVGQDMHWIMRARELKLATVMLPGLLYMRRLHKNNNGNTRSEHLGDRLQIIKTMLDRKRAMVAAKECSDE